MRTITPTKGQTLYPSIYYFFGRSESGRGTQNGYMSVIYVEGRGKVVVVVVGGGGGGSQPRRLTLTLSNTNYNKSDIPLKYQ